MKTEELFNEINDYVFWNEADYAEDVAVNKVKELLKEWKSDLCRQQREICAEEAETKDISHTGSYESYDIVDKDSILSAPEPE